MRSRAPAKIQVSGLESEPRHKASTEGAVFIVAVVAVQTFLTAPKYADAIPQLLASSGPATSLPGCLCMGGAVAVQWRVGKRCEKPWLFKAVRSSTRLLSHPSGFTPKKKRAEQLLGTNKSHCEPFWASMKPFPATVGEQVVLLLATRLLPRPGQFHGIGKRKVVREVVPAVVAFVADTLRSAIRDILCELRDRDKNARAVWTERTTTVPKALSVCLYA